VKSFPVLNLHPQGLFQLYEAITEKPCRRSNGAARVLLRWTFPPLSVLPTTGGLVATRREPRSAGVAVPMVSFTTLALTTLWYDTTFTVATI
jgi:hypothetical protein